MTDLILVIDRGTTNVKAALFTRRLEQVAVASVHNCAPIAPVPGWAEAEPAVQWQTACKAVRQLWEQGHDPQRICAVVVVGQGNGVLLIDHKGQPVRNAVLSLDNRANTIIEGWKADGRYAQAVQDLRFPFGADSPLPILAWFNQHQPEVLESAQHLLFSKDWLRLQLTGQIASDWTDTAGAGLIDGQSGDYAHATYELLGMPNIARLMPPLQQSADLAGHINANAAIATGLPEGLPVFTGAHDICAYHNGLATLSPTAVGIIFGTWAIDVFIVPEDSAFPVKFNHCQPGAFVGGAGDRNAGAVLDAMISILYKVEPERVTEVFSLVEDEAFASPLSRILFVPHLFGHALDGSATGSFLGLDSNASRAALIRAVYEGTMLSNCAYLSSCPGFENFDEIWLAGGGGKSRVLGQILADTLGRPVHVARNSEMVARGGAISALIGLGELGSVTDAPRPEIARTFEPNPANRAYYTEKLAILGELMRIGAPWTKKLSALPLPLAKDGAVDGHA